MSNSGFDQNSVRVTILDEQFLVNLSGLSVPEDEKVLLRRIPKQKTADEKFEEILSALGGAVAAMTAIISGSSMTSYLTGAGLASILSELKAL